MEKSGLRALRASAMIALIGSVCGAAFGGTPWVIEQDIGQDYNAEFRGAHYDGPANINYPFTRGGPGYDQRGVSIDGGYDAYDGAGAIFYYGLPTTRGDIVSLNRRVDALTDLNVYRWIDTYTNNTNESITLTLAMFTNLGSDGYAHIADESAYRFVSYEVTSPESARLGDIPTDPVIAMMHGNNEFAANNVHLIHDPFYDPGSGAEYGDNVFRVFQITLEGGESASLMFADLLAYTPTEGGDPGTTEDIIKALADSQALLADPSPLFADLPRGTNILNWTVPAPGTGGVLALGGLAALRRRRGA